MPPQVVSIVGHQNSGKTRLVTRLVRHFVRSGLRVGTIKHASHAFDVPGKDSHAHFRSGAAVTVLAGDGRTAVFRRERARSLREIVRTHFADVDIVLVEGFRQEGVPRIEVWRRAVARRPLARRADALVTDDAIATLAPLFRPGEIARIADFIAARCKPRGRA